VHEEGRERDEDVGREGREGREGEEDIDIEEKMEEIANYMVTL
jgi:hypothetical protein